MSGVMQNVIKGMRELRGQSLGWFRNSRLRDEGFGHPWRENGRTLKPEAVLRVASERIGNDLKGLHGFCLNAQVKIWP
jgi:hypothetical protein